MMLRKILLINLIALSLLGITEIKATNSTHLYENWGFGLQFGRTSFFGDLADNSGGLKNTPFSKYFYEDMRTMTSISLEKWFSPYFAARGFMGYGQIQGTKETSNAWFEANLFEYHMEAVADLTNLFFGINRKRIVSVSAFVGIGLTESRTWKYDLITDKLIGTNGFGNPKSPEGKYVPMTETVLPVGLIATVFVANKVSFEFEASFHPIHSDKLDATPNANSSTVAGIEGFNHFALGVNFWFGEGGKRNFGRGGAQYSSRSGSSINSRFYKRNTKAAFKRGKSRFKYKRTRR
jgi:hypothetical protein